MVEGLKYIILIKDIVRSVEEFKFSIIKFAQIQYFQNRQTFSSDFFYGPTFFKG
jgi:hypothetical protein